MTHLINTQQAQTETESQILQQTQILGKKEIRAVEISFYDHEIYAGNELIATITHDTDDFVTQRWVVMVNGIEIHRSNTWAKCDSYITWHYTQGTLPTQQQQIEATTGNEIMAQIATECEKFEFDIFDDGIYYNDTKLGEVSCTDGNWWVTRASSQQHHKIPCDSAFSAVWFLQILLASPDIDAKRTSFIGAQSEISHREGLLDKPCDELTAIQWEQLKKYKPLPENMALLTA
ncbi:hypothetical protein [Calothrix sp. PCC 6303]|uniref:hypothetical protein n=1 Tax=Calothrix sp. PCC 6303 TaxID=1170562 RepID=UPI0002A048B6|nr:hypothetical protein [Calothrix sp. PCC 6303]AFY99395.1 hypothetical protein Cal6303_0307 [Calothrix sp. PCC 6303]